MTVYVIRARRKKDGAPIEKKVRARSCAEAIRVLLEEEEGLLGNAITIIDCRYMFSWWTRERKLETE